MLRHGIGGHNGLRDSNPKKAGVGSSRFMVANGDLPHFGFEGFDCVLNVGHSVGSITDEFFGIRETSAVFDTELVR